MESIQKWRLIEYFHQTDLTEIQIINKKIKGLIKELSFELKKNESKGLKEELDQEEKVTIIKLTFEIIKNYLKINNEFTISE